MIEVNAANLTMSLYDHSPKGIFSEHEVAKHQLQSVGESYFDQTRKSLNQIYWIGMMTGLL